MRHPKNKILEAGELCLLTMAQCQLRQVSLVLCLLFLSIPSASAQVVSFTPENCIKALVGEVEGESFQTKLATAECLRNRGSLKGVYGINSRRIAKASKKVWDDCERAWNQSSRANLVKGATVWGNASDVKIFKKSKWFKSYEFVRKIGHHSFFRKRGVK
jgi:hypothetical protein